MVHDTFVPTRNKVLMYRIHFSEKEILVQFSLCVDNVQADAGRDSRTCLPRPNSKARTGTNMFISLFS